MMWNYLQRNIIEVKPKYMMTPLDSDLEEEEE